MDTLAFNLLAEEQALDFANSGVWTFILLLSVLFASLLLANILKRLIPFLKRSLIPTAVLAGLILLIISSIYTSITGKNIFNTNVFGGKGILDLEMITYHALALGFIAQSLQTNDQKVTGKRAKEIFNTGVTTVSTYLLQAILGMGITFLFALVASNVVDYSGVLLPFGYGQGTGQALNFGNIYQTQHGFEGGADFGLSIAALGFLSASIGGVIYLNIMKKKNPSRFSDLKGARTNEVVEGPNEIPMNGSMDKFTFQLAFIAIAYALAFAAMWGLGKLLPGMKATIYGFNFLFGVLTATLVKAIFNLLYKKSIIKRQYQNNFLLTRLSNMFFDVMIVAGIAAIRLETILNYWWILLILGVVGLFATYFYNLFVAKKLFGEYKDEQFLVMYGMLTGTASTGVMLLREADPLYKTPANQNLVLQNFPAIVFGFPLMLLGNLAPVNPMLTFIILIAFFVVMNIILFRSFIFKKKNKTPLQTEKTE